MPPPRGTPNVFEGPGDYDVTSTVHCDTYPEIDPTKVNLTGKTVFISGGSRGVGRAVVLSFVKAGVSHIAVGARSDLSQLVVDIKDAATAARRTPPVFLPIKLDISDRKSVENAAIVVEREFGKCDIVVNNAAILSALHTIIDSDPEDWWNVFHVNVRGTYLISRAFLPLLLKARDTSLIVHVGSVAALLSTPGISAYQMSKLALLRLSQHIHAEYAEQGVISFCIHPGNIPTDIVGGREGLPDHLKPVFTETTEISADTIVYLSSEKREWLGGRYINVTWDMPELMAMKEDIVREDKLKLRLAF